MGMSKKDLYESVNNLKNRMHINDFEYPLDIFDICQNRLVNIEIGAANFKTNDLRGMAIISENVKCENHVILVNANKSPEEINYHGTHELMHITIQHNKAGQAFKCYDKVKPTQDSYIEWQANEGAAEFLVPYRILLPLIKKNYNKMCIGFGAYDFCEVYASQFGVSPVVMQNRLNALSYEIEQYINGTPLNSIKILSHTQQIKQGIHTVSLIEKDDIRFMQSWENHRKAVNS